MHHISLGIFINGTVTYTSSVVDWHSFNCYRDIGLAVAGSAGKGHVLIRRLRTLTFGFLTPFYFIRAGSLISLPALITSPLYES